MPVTSADQTGRLIWPHVICSSANKWGKDYGLENADPVKISIRTVLTIASNIFGVDLFSILVEIPLDPCLISVLASSNVRNRGQSRTRNHLEYCVLARPLVATNEIGVTPRGRLTTAGEPGKGLTKTPGRPLFGLTPFPFI